MPNSVNVQLQKPWSRATHHPVEFNKILEAQGSRKSSIPRKRFGGDDIQEEEGETWLLFFLQECSLSYR